MLIHWLEPPFCFPIIPTYELRYCKPTKGTCIILILDFVLGKIIANMHTGNIPFAVIIHHALNSFIGVVLLDSGSGSKKKTLHTDSHESCQWRIHKNTQMIWQTKRVVIFRRSSSDCGLFAVVFEAVIATGVHPNNKCSTKSWQDLTFKPAFPIGGVLFQLKIGREKRNVTRYTKQVPWLHGCLKL